MLKRTSLAVVTILGLAFAAGLAAETSKNNRKGVPKKTGQAGSSGNTAGGSTDGITSPRDPQSGLPTGRKGGVTHTDSWDEKGKKGKTKGKTAPKTGQ